MIQLVGEDDATGYAQRQRAEPSPVRDITRSEQKRGFLLVKISQLALEQDMIMIGPRDIACTAGAGSATVERLVHGCEDERMLSHSKIVVGTPDRHVLFPATGIQGCAGKPAGSSFQIGEDPVPPFPTQLIEPLAEIRLIIHEPPVAAMLIRISRRLDSVADSRDAKLSWQDGSPVCSRRLSSNC